MEKINIIYVDHYSLYREGLSRVLSEYEDFNILVTSDNISIVPLLLINNQVDLLLLDVQLAIEHKDFIEQTILKQYPELKVVVLSSQSEENYVTELIKRNIHGYLLRNMNKYRFIDSLKQIQGGLTYIHPLLTDQLVKDYLDLLNQSSTRINDAVCTKRERQVLQLLADGQSNREIALTLNISEKTVKNHISNILKKLHVEDRTQAVLRAIKENWVTISQVSS